MEFQDLQRLDTVVDDGEYSVSIKFDRIEQEFTDTDRNYVLYSKVQYGTKDFSWEAVMPTVKIPYRDPALGFMLHGVIFSSVGVYQRAPGVVISEDPKTPGTIKMDIVTSRNSTLAIGYRRNGVQIRAGRGSKKRYIPMGVFLKALYGMPYAAILNQIAYKPPELLNSFPCEVHAKSVDLAKVNTYGVDSDEEPLAEDCIDAVYDVIMNSQAKNYATNYSAHWKLNRIKAYFAGLHFKSESNYESNLSLHSRAIGTTIDRTVVVRNYDADGREQEIKFEAGTYVTPELAQQMRWLDIPVMRVKTTRSFVLQEVDPMLFRAEGYKLASDIRELDLTESTVITRDILKQLNGTSRLLLDVYTPDGRKSIARSGGNPELGDFITMLNALFTAGFTGHEDATQYELANRVVINYDKQVAMEVEQTYQNIIDALVGCQQLKNVLESLPRLPSTQLESHLRDSSTKELAQAETTNVMSRAIAERRASALISPAPAAMTAVQKDQYARIDSLHSPESDKVGAVQELTAMSRINPETSEIEAPYEKVVNGVPTGEIEYISAVKESGKYIAGWDDDLTGEVVMARYNGDVTTVARERVNYRDVSPFCDMSISRMTIPFPEFSQPRRSLMATKMSGQAVPLLFPERPRVSTGADTEVPCLYYTGRDVVLSAVAKNVVEENPQSKLEILNVKWSRIFATYSCLFAGHTFNFSVPFTATDKETLYNYNLNYKEGNVYTLDDIVFYNQSCDIKPTELFERVKQGTLPLIKHLGAPSLALGVNLTVMFKTYASSMVDDAVVISDRLVKNNKLSSIQIFKYSYELKSNEKFVGAQAVLPLHKHVYEGEPVITATRTKTGNEVKKHVFASQAGEVIVSEILHDERKTTAEVWVATLHTAHIGDKVAGRHGNKSVIAKIVPEEEMPYDPETGMSPDIILNPLGIPSRMNYGQVIEVALGYAMTQTNRCAVVTPFYPGIKQEVESLCDQLKLEPKRMYNPVYGKYTERPVMIGTMYILKLEQMSNLKWSAVGYPVAVDQVFDQPISSTNSYKGQSMEEMITWALAAAGANKILGNFFTLYSTDYTSRRRYFDMLSGNVDKEQGDWDESTEDSVQYVPDNKDALVTQTILRMFGLDLIVKDDEHYKLVPLKMDNITIDLKLQAFKAHSEAVSDTEWSKIALQTKVVNPFWIENFPLNVVLGVKSVKALVNKTYYLNVHDRSLIPAKEVEEFQLGALVTGVEAVIALLENTTIEQAIDRLQGNSNAVKDSEMFERMEGNQPLETVVIDNVDNYEPQLEVAPEVVDVIRFLRGMEEEGLTLRDLIWEYMPIMPRVFRQPTVINGTESEHSFTKQLRRICECGTPSDAYNALRQLIGYGEQKNEDLITLRGYFFGKGSASGQHGTVRSKVLSKRIGFSGRAVIVPSFDPEMSPYFIGIPWRIAMIELCEIISMRLVNRASKMAKELSLESGIDVLRILPNLSPRRWAPIVKSLGDYNDYIFRKEFSSLSREDRVFLFHYLRHKVREICEGNVSPDGLVRLNGEWVPPENFPPDATIDAAVVQVGRQPTLHKKSIRCFFMKLVDGYSMSIHPMVCSGFNADFDGDAMHNSQLLGEMKNEGWKTISILQDLISEKDGSYTLGLVQDTALGLYCATIFKNNAKTYEGRIDNYYLVTSANELKMQLEYGNINYYDVVVLNHEGTFYCSTAGRVLVNALVPGALTQIPAEDKDGIIATVFGAEAVSSFCQMKYDTVWLATGIRPEGRPGGVKIEQVLLNVYEAEGPRASVNCAQALYEVGLAASDIYSVSVSMGDMSVDVDVQEFMQEPKHKVAQLNTLQQMGLISDRERKAASVSAWNLARKSAMDAVVKAIPENSNTHFLMYSGARGKPDQVMQTVGFIGTISKTTTSDIEYPILRSYGSGLTSLDHAQTRYMARIGVVSTQTGTKDTGYATRQTVYMSSGMSVVEDDCGIESRKEDVQWDNESAKVKLMPEGTLMNASEIIGSFVDPESPGVSVVLTELNRTGYMLTEEILELMLKHGVNKFDLIDKEHHCVELMRVLNPSWKQRLLEEGYSYALPYTDNQKITEESLDWVEHHGLTSIILFDKEASESGSCFDREAYLPVEYDTSHYTIRYRDSVVSEEFLYGRTVSPDSEGYHLYVRIMGEHGDLTMKALQYLTKKKVRSIQFADGTTAYFSYQLSKLFTELVVGRDSAALPYLDRDGCITKDTLKEIERVQLDYIPVRTFLTCLSKTGGCKHCRGKTPSSKQYPRVGENLGIAAAQAQCEPLSQATLNVTHSGGKRGAGVGLVSGLGYYMSLLHGKVANKKSASQIESFADVSGYVRSNPHNRRSTQIVDEEGKVLTSIYLDNADRLNVPDGAYINKGDTIVSGLPDLSRYCTRDIFTSALKTRYLLMQEYYKIFSSLNVSPRNYEILAREQTSICYLDGTGNLPPTKDTSEEILHPTGQYILRIAKQSEVANKYSGIAGFAFENVTEMLLSGLMNTEGLGLNSVLGNLVTGTPVGSTEAKFIPQKYGKATTRHKKSAVRALSDAVRTQRSSYDSATPALGKGEQQSLGEVNQSMASLLQSLLAGDPAIGGGSENAIPAIPESAEDSGSLIDIVPAEAETAEDANIIDVQFTEAVDAEDSDDADGKTNTIISGWDISGDN